MRVIGITGPTGAGKTTALAAGRALGACVIDADAVYHRLLDSNAALREALVSRFGQRILTPSGAVDRKRLGEIVFDDPSALVDLNRITHRFVGEEIDRLLAAARAEGRPAALIDAIALIESGIRARCEVIVGVLAPEALRIARIVAREGISEDYARLRVRAQKGEGYFRANCDYILENNADDTPEDFQRRAEGLLEQILHKRKESDRMEEEKKEKTPGELRREELCHKPQNGYDRISPEDETAMKEYCEDYKKFLDEGKTERECVTAAVALAEAQGFQPLTRGMALQAGDKVYRINRGRALMLAVLGAVPLSEGANMTAAHIDSPRLDLKQHPLYEEQELAFFKTHYYGGVRKYQWVTIPLELRGVVVLKDGSRIKVSVGGEAWEPIFTIGDLLPHLAQDQVKKPLGEAIPAESLNILVGSRPFRDDKGSDRIKLSILDLLNRKYGMIETDFLSAELIAVPAFNARDVGFDRSLIGAYGQDDRVCAYATLAAILSVQNPAKTAVCVLADKEEIGSEGVSGMKSAFFDTFMSDLCDSQRTPLKACYERSFCLSADVSPAYDPNFPEVYEKRNNAFLNYGLSVCKYTGSRGKSGTSDATAEAMGYARKLFDEAGVIWQTSELGKADQGGGGTVATDLAQRDIETLDAGVPVLSMHSPFEVVAKLDCYMMYKAARAVFEAR